MDKMRRIIFVVFLVFLVTAGIFFIFQLQQNHFSNESDNPETVEIGVNGEVGDETEQIETSQKEKLPVLKSLGVNIKPWNKETNLAGDFIFTKDLLFDDGFIKNEKVFLEFGASENNLVNHKIGIEYWYFLTPGTKVYAASDGVVSIFYIEHTKDWGVNIHPQEKSRWFVGHEHLLNLEVKDGDIVKAGDLLGEAIPGSFSNEVAFTELSVGLGGQEIFKFCPFDFLEPSLKPVYEQKINQLASDWEEFIGQDVYKQEDWVSPGCLVKKIQEK